ncbi:hypothetical protein D9M72_383820 [compost metagenome]
MFFCKGLEFFGFGYRGGEGFFDQHILSGQQGLLGIVEVGLDGRVDNHEVEGSVLQQGFERIVASGLGIVLVHELFAALPRAGQFKAGMQREEGRMKYFA